MPAGKKKNPDGIFTENGVNNKSLAPTWERGFVVSSLQLDPLVVGGDKAVLFGVAQEPQRLLAGAVVLVLQSDKEVVTLHHFLGLNIKDVFYRLFQLVHMVVVLAVVVAVDRNDAEADDNYYKDDDSACIHIGSWFL